MFFIQDSKPIRIEKDVLNMFRHELEARRRSLFIRQFHKLLCDNLPGRFIDISPRNADHCARLTSKRGNKNLFEKLVRVSFLKLCAVEVSKGRPRACKHEWQRRRKFKDDRTKCIGACVHQCCGQRVMRGLEFTSRSFIASVYFIEQLLKHELLERFQTSVGAPQCFAQVSSSILSIEFSAHRAVSDSKALVGASGKNFILDAGEKFSIMLAAKAVEN